MGRIRSLWLFLGLVLFAVSFYDVNADVIPSENECRPYIEKAIHELKNTESTASENDSIENKTGEETSTETITTSETVAEGSNDNESVEDTVVGDNNSQENQGVEEESSPDSNEDVAEPSLEQGTDDEKSKEVTEDDEKKVTEDDSTEENNDIENENDTKEEQSDDENDTKEEQSEVENENDTKEEQSDDENSKEKDNDSLQEENKDSNEETSSNDNVEEDTTADDGVDSKEEEVQAQESLEESENNAAEEDNDSKENKESTEDEQNDDDTKEENDQTQANEDTADTNEEETTDDNGDSAEETVRAKRSISDEATPENDTKEDTAEESDTQSAEEADNTAEQTDNSLENVEEKDDVEEDSKENNSQEEETPNDQESNEADIEEKSEEETMPEEELIFGYEVPKNLRKRDHISDLLGLDAESSIKENALKRTGDVILKELKRVYDNAIKPLETMYKYRDLSNRHYGDPEIFSKPLIVFMGPYSGGKSTILNYLTDNEYTPNSIRSGAEPSPAYFNILMHGEEPEVLDGTQLAADWTFSGLQKFGQGLNDRLRGQKLPSKLLERVNIVEIPGILEVRKQVSRYFPFNDACQWFIDRADIIFLVYDPAKLDVGPETEAILDQLKGREYQTRILLNKGDQVKPEELLRIQSALIWNISPLMSSAQPPVMYTVSLWSAPFEQGAPIRLLQAQERAMLADLREAIDKRIENKIASARRFAVRIRNHAKMVDCYLTTYYNQKSLFSNKKQVSDKIIEHPQNYNIYEGLSTLTNISRYDLPDPEVYLDFFRLNPLYEFKKLSETCTYFKGCPINKLDIAIAYELPELVGRYKKLLDENYIQLRKEFDENCNQSNIEPQVKLNAR